MENPDRPGDQPRPKTPKPTTEPTHNKHKRPHASTGGFRFMRPSLSATACQHQTVSCGPSPRSSTAGGGFSASNGLQTQAIERSARGFCGRAFGTR